MSRGLKVLLFGSLALNLLIVGVVAGVILSGGPGKDRREARSDVGGFTLVRALPRDARADLRARFETKRKELRASGGNNAPSKQDILTSLRATPFDPQAFADLVSTQTRSLAERGRLGQEALVEQVAEMTDDERRAYADDVEEAFSRRRAPREDRERQRR
jgi:uncharacterized membrane protein